MAPRTILPSMNSTRHRILQVFSGLVALWVGLFLLTLDPNLSPTEYILIGAFSVLIGVIIAGAKSVSWVGVMSALGFGAYMLARGFGEFEHYYIRNGIGIGLVVLALIQFYIAIVGKGDAPKSQPPSTSSSTDA